jgi:lipopolysaccharide/colanic/teichoic acid biosynthesis glycosyltransferase/RimJ/RimL family protein N-acetyltransferase
MSEARRLQRFNRIKRVVDVAIVVATAPLTTPLTAVVALVVRLRIGRPVLFRQERAGLHDEPFELLKFRTMTDARDPSGELLPDRERLTAAGRTLRALSLDELPQLANIARGDMSFVGPRPLYVHYLPFYSARERTRHLVRPGLTGLSQVSGRNAVAWDQRLELDATYVERASLRQDFVILVRTVVQVVRGSGVSVLASDSGEPLSVERSYPSDAAHRLRRLRASDLGWRVHAANHPRIRQFMQWPEGITLESTLRWFEEARVDKDRVDFTAVSREDGAIVAMAGLKRVDGTGTGEFYVFVDPQRHGQGIGRAVTELVLQWATAQPDYDRVTLTVDSRNTAAVRVYTSLGFEVTHRVDGRLTMAWTGEA